MKILGRRVRTADLGAILVLVLLPLGLLSTTVFGDQRFMPSDPARFPPAVSEMSDADRTTIREARSNDDVTELPFLVVPEIKLAEKELEAGRLPTWNPYARFGAPLFANGLAGLAYPPNALLLLGDDPERGLGLAAWLSYAIAGITMLAFLRAVHLSPSSALFGAIVFMLSGTLTANAHFYMRTNALIWLPAMLLATLRLARATDTQQRLLPTLILAGSIGLTWLAGFPPYAIACTAFAGLYAAALTLGAALNPDKRTPATLHNLLWTGIGIGIGLALSAIQLAPALAYFPQSSRDLSPPVNQVAAGGFDPFGFLGYILPTAFGEPDGSLPSYGTSPLALALQSREHWADAAPAKAGQLLFPSNFNFTEYSIFLGSLPLLLAILGLVSRALRTSGSGDQRSMSTRSHLLGLLGIGIVFAVIATAPSWLAPLYNLPGAPKTPMRWIAPLSVVGAAFAAFGFDTVRRGGAPRAAFGIGAFGVLLGLTCGILAGSSIVDHDFASTLAARFSHFISGTNAVAQMTAFVGEPNLGAAGPRLQHALVHAAWTFGGAGLWLILWARLRRRASSGAATRGGWLRPSFLLPCATVLFATVELTSFGRISNVPRDMPVDASDTTVHEFLRAERDRRSSRGGLTFMRAARLGKTPIDLPSGLTFPDRLRDITAYAFSDPWSHRLFEAEYGKGHMYRQVWPNAFPDDPRLTELPLFDLLGVDMIVSAEPLQHAGVRVGPGASSDGRDFYIYQRPNPLPRAFVVHSEAILGSDDDVVRAMREPKLDPRRAVMMTAAEHEKIAGTTHAVGVLDTPPSSRPGELRPVTFTRDTPSDVILDIPASEDGRPAYLVLADACLDGWHATVNDRASPHARGNLFMRVVPIGAEHTEVRFRYTPPGLGLGAGISAFAGLVCLLALVSFWRGSRRVRATDEKSG